MTTVVSLKLDKEVKDEATKLVKSVGLTLSGVVNSYLHELIATRRIDIRIPEEMTPKMERIIGQIEAEIARGEVSEPFDNVEDFIADLKK